jgi:molybdopterin-binding protein
MPGYGVGQVAEVLGVSPDTVRRWVESGKLKARRDRSGRRAVQPPELARFMASEFQSEAATRKSSSARNHFTGVVTRVVKDTVVAQVELQAGPHRMVSLITREAVDDLGLVPGVIATAVVKATNVSIELGG